jgi:outer membrane usher protein
MKPLNFKSFCAPLIIICLLVISSRTKAEELLVSLTVNNRRCPDIAIIKYEQDRISVGTSYLKSCNVTGLNDTTLEINNTNDQYHYDLDLAKLELNLTIPEDMMGIEQIDASTTKIGTGIKTYAFGLNYDVTATHINSQNTGAALPEALMFTPYGFFRTSGLIRISPPQEFKENTVRLESTFIKEFPEYLSSLRIGDGITRPSSWTAAVRIGGIQWASNFNTQENFIYYPLPSISGTAALQTPLDVFIRSSQVYSGQLPPGPYEINNLPVVTGAGNLRLESVDLLGRKVQIEAPYYVTPDLLKEGLHDYSYEIGTLRSNYGFKSNDYRKLAGVLTHRYGLTNTCTIGIHSELTSKTQLVGIDVSKLVADWALVTVSGAINKSQNKTGQLFQASLTRQASPIGFGIRATTQSPAFRDLSTVTYNTPQKFSLQAYIGYHHETMGSLSVSYTTQKRQHFPKTQFITATYHKPIGLGYSCFISALKNIGSNKNYAIMLGISKSFDNNLIVEGTANKTSESERQSFSFNKGISGNYGTLYRGRISHEDNDLTGEAYVAKLTPYGDINMMATRYPSNNLYQVGASGAALYTQDSFVSTQKINSSLGVVKAADIPDITVKNNNLEVGTTNRNGTLVIPNLNTFSRADIKLQDEDIPMDVSYQKSTRKFYADSTSAYLIDFDLKRIINRSLKIKLQNHQPIPVGTIINWDDGTTSTVGFDGDIFLTDTHPKAKGSASVNNTTCTIDLAKEKSHEDNTSLSICHSH